MPVTTALIETDQPSIAKNFQEAMDTKVAKPYGDFQTEGPEPWDPRGASAPTRRTSALEEEERRKRIMKEWKNKPEKPLWENRPVVKCFSTEDAAAKDLIDQLDIMFETIIKRVSQFTGNSRAVRSHGSSTVIWVDT